MYKCLECGSIHTAEQWNNSTDSEFNDNTAKLPTCFVPNNVEEDIKNDNYMSDMNLPCFVCPTCGFCPMANELIEVVK